MVTPAVTDSISREATTPPGNILREAMRTGMPRCAMHAAKSSRKHAVAEGNSRSKRFTNSSRANSASIGLAAW